MLAVAALEVVVTLGVDTLTEAVGVTLDVVAFAAVAVLVVDAAGTLAAGLKPDVPVVIVLAPPIFG